jgi:WD40 repeat protein
MKIRTAYVLALLLVAPLPGSADSSRRREVVDLTRLDLLRTIDKGWTHSLAPGGQAFALFDANLVRVYDTFEGKEIQTLSGHNGLIHDSGWSRDGRFIATAGYDAAVHVWDVSTGKSILRLHPHSGYACSVAFSGDGKWLATGGSEDGQIKIFEIASGRQLRSIQTQDISIYAMAFTPEGRHLVVNHSLTNRVESSLRVFRTADGSEVRDVATGPVSAFAVSRDGRMLAYSNPKGSIVLVETGGWTELRRLDGHQTGASAIAFHPISRYLASTGRDGAVRIWDSESGKQVNSLGVKKETDSRMVFGSDGMSLVVSSADGKVRVYGRPESYYLPLNAGQARETDPKPSPTAVPEPPPRPLRPSEK